MTPLLQSSEQPGKAALAPGFRELFEAEADYILHTLRRLGVRTSDVEDVAHEVFLTVHRLLPTFDPTRPRRPWLFAIAFRAASDHRRRAYVNREVPSEDEDLPSEAPLADELMEASERKAMLEEALATLDLDRRAVLLLHDLDEQAMPVIAEALGIPLNTAYSRLRLARADLRANLARLVARRQRGAP